MVCILNGQKRVGERRGTKWRDIGTTTKIKEGEKNQKADIESINLNTQSTNRKKMKPSACVHTITLSHTNTHAHTHTHSIATGTSKQREWPDLSSADGTVDTLACRA